MNKKAAVELLAIAKSLTSKKNVKSADNLIDVFYKCKEMYEDSKFIASYTKSLKNFQLKTEDEKRTVKDIINYIGSVQRELADAKNTCHKISS